MNAAHFHLIANHFPILLPLIGLPIFAVGFFRKMPDVKDVGIWLFLTAALAAIPVYLSGDPAEKLVKNYPDVSRNLIHIHEHFALRSLIVIEVLGVVSLYLLWAQHKRIKNLRIAHYALLILACISFLMMARTAQLGGQIRHEEIRDTLEN